MRPLGLVGNLVGVEVGVVKQDAGTVPDAPECVAGRVLPDLVAADVAQFLQGAFDRGLLLAGVAANGDQVRQERLLTLVKGLGQALCFGRDSRNVRRVWHESPPNQAQEQCKSGPAGCQSQFQLHSNP